MYEHKVARISKIKSRADEDEDRYTPESAKRPVVDLEMCLGNVKRTVEVNLTDRSSFNYPLLIASPAPSAIWCGGKSDIKIVSVGIKNSRSEERRVGKECRSRWSPYH